MKKVIRNIPQPNDIGYDTWASFSAAAATSLEVQRGPSLKVAGSTYSGAHETPFLVVRETWLTPHEGDYERQLQFSKGDAIQPRYVLTVRALSASESSVDETHPGAVNASQSYLSLRTAMDNSLEAMADENAQKSVRDGELTFKAHVRNRYAARDDSGPGADDLTHFSGARIILEDAEWHGIPVEDVRYDPATKTVRSEGPVWPGDLMDGDVVSLVCRYKPYKVGKKQGFVSELVSIRRWVAWADRADQPMEVSLPF